MMPFFDPRFPGDAKASHFQLVLRRRPDGNLPELDQDAQEELSQIIAYLESLRNNPKDAGQPVLKEESEKSGETDQENAKKGFVAPPRLTLPFQRGLRSNMLRAARRRLMRKPTETGTLTRKDLMSELVLLTDTKLSDYETAPVEPKPGGSATVSDEPKTGETALPPTQSAAKPAAPVRRAKRPVLRVKRPFVLAGAALLAVVGGTMFLWMRPASPSRADRLAEKTAADEPISAEASRTADLALGSIQNGRLEEASGVLTDAQEHGVILPGLHYQAALLALRQGDVRAATGWISRSMAARECVPECLYLRANVAGTDGDYAAACNDFETAAGYAAFSPRYFFFRAEALRRYGHSAQALPQFERALLCRPNSTDTDLIRFKMGLAEIEAGAREKFESQLRSLLAQKAVPGDALLLAAAVEINRAAYPAAAEYLRRAKEAMPPALLAARLRDFLFRTRAHQADLAAVWPAAVSAGPVDPGAPEHAHVVLIDPATRTLAEADPAVW